MSINPQQKNVEIHTQTKALSIVSHYKGIWDTKPERILTGTFADAPLLGNGDLGVIVSGTAHELEFFLSKNEFLSQNEGIPKAMSRVQLYIPDLEGASHHMEQQLLHAHVDGEFVNKEETLRTKSWVQATDTQSNLLFTKITYTGTRECQGYVTCLPGVENSHTPFMSWEGDVLCQDVRADLQDKLEGYDTPKARIAARVAGPGKTEIRDSTLFFTLCPGCTYYLAFCVMSVSDHKEYRENSVRIVSELTPKKMEELYASHCQWWETFWGKSFVEIPYKDIEKEFYGSLYLLACCLRAGEATPTIYGNWVMKNMYWGGMPPLNYNYEAPYFCTIPTNHQELSDNYETLLFDWMGNAAKNAKESGFSGLYYEAYPGPLPYGVMFSANRWNGLDYQGRDCYMCQKSNGVFTAVNMILRYYYTKDKAYAEKIYPFLKGVGDFWLDYLKWDGSRYVICDDYVHEGPVSILPQTNPLTSLAFVRLLFQGLLDIDKDLGLDTELKDLWQDRLDHISEFPVFQRNGQTVFRNQEAGESIAWSKTEGYPQDDFSEWSSPGAIPEMALLYPGGQIGCFSDPRLLEIARNTLTQQAKWRDQNMTCFFYPSAARVRYDPVELLARLSEWLKDTVYPNMAINAAGGGIENLNTVPATLVEMLCQSYQGRLWVFPDWPDGADARFGNLLAYGGFLVSSQYKEGSVRYLQVISKKGEVLTIVNPWPGRSVRLYQDGIAAKILEGNELSLPTQKGQVLCFVPEGTSYTETQHKIGSL